MSTETTTVHTVPGRRSARPDTEIAHRRAVDRALEVIHQRFGDEHLSLGDLASAAYTSRFHFERLFRSATGVPPCHFLAAVRMQAAKKLLLETRLSVTDICLEVGYTSLGTFTRRFVALVGMSPRHFRGLGQFMPADLPASGGFALGSGSQHPAFAPCVGGVLVAPDDFQGLAFVGLFRTAIPQGGPLACGVFEAPGRYRLGPAADGACYVLATAVSRSGSALRQLLYAQDLRARCGPITIAGGWARGDVDLALRPPEPTDAPIVIVPGWRFLTHPAPAVPAMAAMRFEDERRVAAASVSAAVGKTGGVA